MQNQVFNPYLPLYEYVPDGEPHVFGDRLYIFGSHDQFGGDKYCANDYVCYSTPVTDLSQWRFEGYIYHKTQDPINPEGKYKMYAPDVVQGVDGRYYLYYGFDEFVSPVSVAVCDTPAGHYDYYGVVSHPDGTVLGQKEGDAYQFDPGVLVDDDHKIWLYTGFSPKAEAIAYANEHFKNIKFVFSGAGSDIVQLADDMKTIISTPKKLIPGVANSEGTGYEGHEFFEASSMRKFDGRYYFIYSTIVNHELAYAVSDYPDRDFVYAGLLHSNADLGYQGNTVAKYYGGNNHGSIVKVLDQFYIFGHRQTGYNEYSRQGVAEKLVRRADGTFEMAEMTSCGLNNGPLIGLGRYSAGIACNLWSAQGAMKVFDMLFAKKQTEHPRITQSGQDRESDADQYITNLQSGGTVGFKYFDFKQPQVVAVEMRGTGTGEMHVKTAEDSAVIATIAITPTTDWTWFSADIATTVNGVLPLYFEYRGTESVEFRTFELK